MQFYKLQWKKRSIIEILNDDGSEKEIKYNKQIYNIYIYVNWYIRTW